MQGGGVFGEDTGWAGCIESSKKNWLGTQECPTVCKMWAQRKVHQSVVHRILYGVVWCGVVCVCAWCVCVCARDELTVLENYLESTLMSI